MKKERDITINVINNKKVNINRLAEYFSRRYTEKYIEKHTNKKS